MNCTKRTQIDSSSSPCIHYIPAENPKEAGFCKLPSIYRCIESLKHKSLRLSHSTVQDYLTCRRLFYVKHIAGLMSRDDAITTSMKRGKLYDIVIGQMYKEISNEKKQAELINYINDSKIDLFSIAMVEGTIRGIKEFVDPSLNKFVGTQEEFHYHHYDSINGDIIIHGFYDRLYKDHFVESKFTGYPNIYTTYPFHILPQVGTYFLADDNLKYVIMEVMRVPALKPKDGESPELFSYRVYSDIIKRPSYYMIGLNKSKRMFGKIFYRNEFNLDQLNERYGIIIREIKEMIERDSYYPNETSCEKFGNTCGLLGTVCELDGKFNIENFKIRKKPGEKDET